jgi:gamma-glutamyltranspeptidase/glutathione hydrolase
MDQAPRALDIAAFRKLKPAERSTGVHSICTPGLPSGLMFAHQTWGKLPRADVVAPSIKLARDGFEVLPGTVRLFKAQEAKLKANRELGRLYYPNGALPKAGTRLANMDLAKTLEAISKHGAVGFYAGPVGNAIIAEMKRLRGPINAADLSGYHANGRAPLMSKFGGTTIVSGPPPSTGGSMLTLTLSVLENHLPDSPALRTPETLDRVLRAYREVNNAVWRGIADTPDARDRLRTLGSEGSLESFRKAAFGGAPAAVAAVGGEFPEESPHASTSHFVVVDGDGNVVSATQSLSNHFGSGIVAPGTGVVLNNTMSNFSVFTEESPNIIVAGKRPRSTVTPVILLRDGKPVAAAGIPGAARIPTAMIQTLLDVLHFGRSWEEAIADTRWHLATSGGSEEPTKLVHIEAGADDSLVAGLRERGWTVEQPEGTEYFGGITAIEIRTDGSLRGVADQRRTNWAAGF